MNLVTKTYYKLTAAFPRKLPTTEQEYQKLESILQHAYGIPDAPASWATLAGQIQNTPVHKLSKPYGHIANVIKRLSVNELAQAHKSKAMTAFQEQFAAAVAKVAKEEEAKNAIEKTEEIQPVADEVAKQEAPAESAVTEEINPVTH